MNLNNLKLSKDELELDQAKPLRHLAGKKIKVIEFVEKLISTNTYLFLLIEVDGETDLYQTSSNVIRRQLYETKEFPYTCEFVIGGNHRGKWYAFKTISP